MAKAPFWLRGGKGKLAGSVLFKGEKGTIVRENVTPHNPQSGGQMRQRVVFATITQAAKLMLPIIGISFEGVTSEKLNRRQFVKLNATLFSNIARNIMQSGLNPQKCAFSGKGNNQLIGNPYIVARGSLKLPKEGIAVINNSGTPEMASSYSVEIPFGSYTPLQLWEIIFGFKPGSQLTYPYIDFKAGNNNDNYAMFITDDLGENIDGIRYGRFHAPRIVLAEEDGNSVTINGEVDVVDIEDSMAEVVVTGKSDIALLGYLCTFEITSTANNKLTVQVNCAYEDYFLTGSSTLASVGLIYSEKDADGNWRYTNSRMVSFNALNFRVPGEAGYYAPYSGLTLQNAMQSFRKSTSSDKNYLQTGGEGGNI